MSRPCDEIPAPSSRLAFCKHRQATAFPGDAVADPWPVSDSSAGRGFFTHFTHFERDHTMSKDFETAALPDPLVYQRHWDFLDKPITEVVQMAPVAAGADADDDVSATVCGVIPRASRLIGGYSAVTVDSTGVDASNTSAWTVAIGGTTALSKTNEANLAAATPVDLGTPAITDISEGDAVTLAITNGTAADLNSASCIVALEVADYNNFPQPGLKVIASDGGTVTIADGVKGICALSPGSSDNDEIYMVVTTETVKFADGETAVGEAILQWSEANTDDSNLIFGFMSAAGANALVDDGAGPRASGDYVALWKIDGGTQYYAGVQANGTAKPTVDALGDPLTTAGGSSYQKLKVKVVCSSSTQGFAMFWVDEQHIATIHFTYASATEMQLMVGIKNGGANAETLNVDALGYVDNRSA